MKIYKSKNNLIIPKKLDSILQTIKRKDSREALIKIFSALVYKDSKYNKIDRNSSEFFPVPSNYLEKINSRYYNKIKLLIDNKIIEYKSATTTEYKYDTHNQQYYRDTNSNSIFENEYRRKYYDTEKGICMQYRFLIDIDSGREIETDIEYVDYRKYGWYNITKRSLQKLNLNTNITRDNYSRRVHTIVTRNMSIQDKQDIITSYKHYFNKKSDYYTIDISTCQPSLLVKYLTDNSEEEHIDENFNPVNLYDYIVTNTSIDSRDKAKKAFATWLYSIPNRCNHELIRLFPKLNSFMYEFKRKNGYKALGAKLTYLESTIIIDDILNNINLDFCLSVHDSIIVKSKDAEKAFDYCNKKYKWLKFKKEKI